MYQYKNPLTHLRPPEPFFISGYAGFCPDLLNRIGVSYPWATFEVLAEHPEYGERLAPIKPRGYPFKGDGWKPVTFPGYWQKHSKKHNRCKCSSHKNKHKHVHSKTDFCGDKGRFQFKV
ncbi:uncharacterized protein TNIN_337501 [Trichonephila inaurata madagascariensis]|uniref:Uncharacterized protein n=1 Tax=Trichonephila inaurata madagascariensis TaxID=2747483 RepID=A0A8X6XKW4_9ARAC|nr:uncharacterized protein TNIN_337501 [Trichonephila inaurata madagascariensis]